MTITLWGIIIGALIFLPILLLVIVVGVFYSVLSDSDDR